MKETPIAAPERNKTGTRSPAVHAIPHRPQPPTDMHTLFGTRTSTSRSTRTSPWQCAITSSSGRPPRHPSPCRPRSAAHSSPASAAVAAAVEKDDEAEAGALAVLLVLWAVPVCCPRAWDD